jgi:hypothetical protein
MTQVRLMRTFVHPWTAHHWSQLAPQPLSTLCLEHEGVLGGLLLSFDVNLAEGVRIITQSAA